MTTGGDRTGPPLSIRLFGPFDVRLNGGPLPRLRSQKGQWLLALLILRHGREVERSWLAGTLWPDSPEPQALANLRNSLTDLRQALGPVADRLRAPTPRTLSLDLAGAEVDVVLFDAAVAAGDGPALDAAVDLYRGPLLEGCAEEWAFQERETRQQAYLAARERLAAAAMARGEPAEAERHLRRAVVAEPTRESAQRRLMEALAASGNYAAAIQAYRELREHLHREMNAEPDPQTRALFDRIRAEARGRAGVQAVGRSAVPADPASPPHHPASPPPERPLAGGEDTVTFLFTDIEGSSRLWEEQPDVMRLALARHDALVRDAIETRGGRVFKTLGDAFCAAFATATEALAAALAVQRAVSGVRVFGYSGVQEKPASEPEHLNARTPEHLKLRIALHTGAAELREGDYLGPALNRVARLLEVAHGGQVLLSSAVQGLVQDDLPAGAMLRDLGTHRLRDLQRAEQIYQLLHPDLPADFPAPRSLSTLPNNLPQQVTSFIGREREIADVKALLGVTAGDAAGSGVQVFRRSGVQEKPASEPEHLNTRTPEHPMSSDRPFSRLVTLSGVGGTGKTRLALQIAADLLQSYRDGVWLVELAPLADPALVTQAVAGVIGVREEPGQPLLQSLLEYLKDRTLLLLLDNCEHLLDAAAALADALLRGCPGLQILASSREGLGIPGEQTYRVPSLSLPDPGEGSSVEAQGSMVDGSSSRITHHASRITHHVSTLNPQPSTLLQYEAVRLFVERAMSSLPSFTFTEANAPAVLQICRRLDGIPLAIELAAARVKALTVEQIVQRLDDRFRLLTGGSRTALPRQQTLRALIDWSYDLLPEPERVLLRRLSVFTGGWTLEAAEAICSAEGFGVQGTDYRVADSASASPTPDPCTLYPSDVLDLLTALVDKSLVQYEGQESEGRYWLLETVRQYGRDRLVESGEGATVRRHGEFFLQLALEAEPNLRGGEPAPWLRRLDTEYDNLRTALAWYQAAPLPDPFAEPGSREGLEGLRLAGALADFWYVRSYFHEGRRWLEAALERHPSPTGDVARYSSSFISAWTLASITAGRMAISLNEHAQARSVLERVKSVAASAGDQRAVASAEVFLAINAFLQGDFQQTRSHGETGLALSQELDDPWLIGWAHYAVGHAALREGNYQEATFHFVESRVAFQRIGNPFGIAWGNANLTLVAHLWGCPVEVEMSMAEVEALFRRLGQRMGLGWALWVRGLEAFDRGDSGAARTCLEEGLTLFRQIGHVLGQAFTLLILGYVAQSRDDGATARQCFREGLALFTEGGFQWGTDVALEGFGHLAIAAGDPARAARLLGAAAALREATGAAPLSGLVRRAYEGDLAAARAALGEAAFTTAWEEGRAMGLQQALAYAREA